MSEYQYYEFLAIDRPLTEDEMAELRALSTRATITPVSFTNEYNWGDFRGDPEKVMERYFDVHVYVANWMTAIFMLRLPMEALDKEIAEALAVPYNLDFKATKTHWIITWSLEESENYDRFGMEDGRGWMARLAPVRDELLRGDLRSLYIGWLAAVTDVRKRHFRKKGFMAGFEDIVSGAPKYVEPPFLERAKARWPRKSGGR